MIAKIQYQKQQAELFKQQEKIQRESQEVNTDDNGSSEGGAFSFLGNLAGSGGSEVEPSGDVAVSGVEDRRRRLAKRLMSITDKLEELSNQIYHLQQRIEVMERKSGVGNY